MKTSPGGKNCQLLSIELCRKDYHKNNNCTWPTQFHTTFAKRKRNTFKSKKKINATFNSQKKNCAPYSLDCFVFVLSRHFSKVFGTYGSTVIISAKHAISHLAEIEPLQESKKIHNGLKLFLKFSLKNSMVIVRSSNYGSYKVVILNFKVEMV